MKPKTKQERLQELRGELYAREQAAFYGEVQFPKTERDHQINEGLACWIDEIKEQIKRIEQEDNQEYIFTLTNT